jgi:transcriptional regulator with XRE-family HTH domain
MALIPERLKEQRKLAGLKQTELSALVKISVTTISRMENGKTDPKTEELSKIAYFIKTSTGYLNGETDDPRPPTELRLVEFKEQVEVKEKMPAVKRASLEDFVRAREASKNAETMGCHDLRAAREIALAILEDIDAAMKARDIIEDSVGA